jgi:hypothetical protein
LCLFPDDNRNAPETQQSIPVLIGMLAANDQACATQAAFALAVLAQNIECLSEQHALEIVDPLLQCLQSDSALLLEKAAFLVSCLCSHNQFQASFIASQEGAATLLVELLSSQHASVQSHGSLAIANICRDNNKNILKVASAGAVPVIVSLLLSESIQVRDFSVQAIASITSGQNWADRSGKLTNQRVQAIKTLATAEGAVIPLVAMLRNQNQAVVHCSVVALANIACQTEAQRDIPFYGGIELLVWLLRAPATHLNDHGARALANITCAPSKDDGALQSTLPALPGSTPILPPPAPLTELQKQQQLVHFVENQRKVAESNGILPLVELLKLPSAHASLLENVCATIANVAALADNKNSLAEHGTIPLLVRLIESGEAAVHDDAARALAALSAKHDTNGLLVVEAGGVDPLIQLLASTDPLVKENASWALNGVASRSEATQQLVASAGGLHALTLLLQSQEVASVQRKAARAVGTILLASDNREQFFDSIGIRLLVQLLEKQDERVQKNSLRALRHVAAHHPSKTSITSEGAIPLLLGILQDGSDKLIELSLQVLLSVAADTVNRKLIMEHQPLSTLFTLFTSAQTNIIQLAVAVIAELGLDEDNQMTIFNAGALAVLARLLTPDNLSTICNIAMIALANLVTTHESIQQALVAIPGVLPRLVELLESPDAILLQSAVLLLSRLTVEAKNKDEVNRTEGLAPLVALLSNSDSTVIELSCCSLANLALKNELNKTDLRAMDTNRALVQLLNNNADSIQEQAANALASMADGTSAGARSNRREIVESGGLRPLLSMLKGSTHGQKAASALAIGNLAHGSRQNQDALVKKNAIPLLLEMLGSPHPQVQWKSCWAIANLAQLPQNKVIIAQQGCIPALAALLNAEENSDDQVQKYGAMAIAYIAAGNNANKVAIANSGAVEPLTRFTFSTNEGVVESATLALAKLAAHGGNSAIVGESGGTARLVKLLQSPILGIQKNAISAVAALCMGNDSNKVRIAEAGAIPDICALLNSNNGMVLESTVTALAQLAMINSNKAAIANHTDLPKLTQFLSSPNRKMQEQAGLALQHLSLNDRNKQLLGREDALQLLVEALQEENRTVVEGVVHTVANLSFSDENKPKLMTAGVSAALVALLPRSTEDDLDDPEEIALLGGDAPDIAQEQAIVEHAVLAIANLACATENKTILAAEGVMTLLVPLLNSPSIFLQKCTCWAIVNLCTKHQSNSVLCTNEGAILRLIGLLQSHNHSVVETAAWGLGVLALHNDNSMQIANNKAMPILINLLQSSAHDRVLERVARLIGTMIRDEKIREKAIEQGETCPLLVKRLGSSSDRVKKNCARALVQIFSNESPTSVGSSVPQDCIPALVALLRSPHEKVQRNAAQALAELSRNEAYLEIVAEADGLAPLVALLSSMHVFVVKAAVFALSHLSNWEPHLAALYAEGIVQVLVPLLTSHDIDIEEYSLCTLSNLSSGHNDIKAAIASESGILAVLTILRTAEERMEKGGQQVAILKYSVKALANLSQNDDNKIIIVEDGGVEILLATLRLVQERSSSPTESVIQENTVRTLAYLSFEDSSKARIMSAGAGPDLVALLTAPNSTVLENAVLALGNLASLQINKQLIANDGAIPLLIDLLRQHAEAIESDEPTTKTEWVLKCSTYALANLLSKNDATKVLVHRHGGVPILVKLLSSNIEAVQECSAWALASLAHVAETAIDIAQAGERGGILPLISLLQANNEQLQIKASRAIGWLSANGQSQYSTRSKGSIPALIILLRSEQERVRKNAAFALSHLARDDNRKISVADFGGIPPIVALLTSQNVKLLTHAVHTLRSLASLEDHQVLIGLEGANAYLIKLASSGDTDLQLASLQTLALLSMANINKGSIFDAGGLPPLLSILRNEISSEHWMSDTAVLEPLMLVLANLAPYSEQIQAVLVEVAEELVMLIPRTSGALRISTVLTLAHISALEGNKLLLSTSGTISVMLDLLDHETDTLVEGALLTLAYLTTRNEKNKVSVATDNGRGVLLNLLTGPVRSAALAAWILANLGSQEKPRDQLVQEGALSPLVALLNSSNADAQLYAAWAITNLCNDRRAHQLLAAEFGAISPLVALLKSNNGSVKLNSVLALAKLSSVVENAALIVEEGGVAPFVGLLESNNLVLLENALLALGNLAASIEHHKETIVNAGVLVPLMRHLHSDHAAVQLHAIKVLSRLSDARRNIPAIGEANGVAPLVALLDSRQESIVQFTAQALANLSLDHDNMIAITVEDGVPLFIKALHKSTQGSVLQQDILLALANLSRNDEIRVIMVSEDGVKPLLDLLLLVEGNALEYTVQIIANLSLLESARMAIIEGDGVRILVQLLTFENATVVESALTALKNTTTSSEIGALLTNCGAIMPLVSLLGSRNVTTQGYAVQILAQLSLIDDSVCRTIIDDGGMVPLVELLQSPQPDLQQGASLALANLSQHEDCCDRIVQVSGISSLVHTLHMSNTQVAAQSAHTLGNLAAKYCDDLLADEHLLKHLLEFVQFGGDPNAQIEAISALNKIAGTAAGFAAVVEHAPAIFAPMGAMMRSDITGLQEQSVLLLRNLSSNAECSALLVRFELMKELGLLLQSSNGALRNNAAEVIVTLMESEPNRPVAVAGGLASALVAVLRTPQSDDTRAQERAVEALAHICQSPELARIVAAELVKNSGTAVDSVLSLVRSDDDAHADSKASLLQAQLLANVCLIDSAADVALKNGAVSAILSLLDSSHAEAAHLACTALFKLCTLQKNGAAVQQVFRQNNGVQLLVTLVLDNSRFGNLQSSVWHPRLKDSALVALNSVCSIDTVRQELVRTYELVPILVAIVENSPAPADGVQLRVHATNLLSNLAQVPALREEICDSGAIEELQSLLNSRDATEQACAAEALRTIAPDEYSRAEVVSKAPDDPANLLAQLNSTEAAVVSSALFSLAKFCLQTEASRTQVVRGGGISVLLGVLNRPQINVELQISVVQVLESLTATPTHWEAVVTAGTAARLITLLQQESTTAGSTLLEPVLVVLSRIVSCIGSHQSMVSSNGVPLLGSVMRTAGNTTSAIELATRVLAELCQDESARIVVAKEINIESFLALVGIPSASEGLVCSAVRCLEQLAKEEAYMQLVIQDPDGLSYLMSTLIAQLNSASQTVQQHVASALANTCSLEQEPKVSFVVEHGLPLLMQLLSSTSFEVQEQAGRLVAQLCTHEGVRELVVAEGGLAPLIGMLQSTSIGVLTNAVEAFANISLDEHAQGMFAAEEGCIRILVGLLESEISPMQESAVRAVANLSWNEEMKMSIATFGGIPSLLKLLQSDNAITLENAILSLANISSVGSNKQILLDNFGIKILLPYLSHENEWVQKCCVWATANLCHKNSTSCRAVLASNGLQRLVQLLSSTNETSQECSAWVLASILKQTSSSNELVAAGAVRPLTTLLTVGNDRVQKRACRAIANLLMGAEPTHPIASLIDSNCISDLITLLRHQEQDVQKNACRALSMCAGNTEGKGSILQTNNGLIELIQLLSSSTGKVQDNAVVAITKLAKDNDEVGTTIVGTKDAVAALTGLLSASDTRVCEHAADALELLSQQPSLREAIASMAVSPAVRLLAQLHTKESQESLLYAIVQLLGNLSSGNVDTCNLIIQEGACSRLVTLLGTTPPSVLSAVLLLIVNLATISKGREQLLVFGAATALLDTLQSDALPGTKEYALLALAQLSSEDKIKEVLAKEGGIPLLTGLLKSNNSNIQGCAAWALSNIATLKLYRAAIRAAGALPVLQSLAGGTPGGDDTAAKGRPTTARQRISKYVPLALQQLSEPE